MTPTQSRFVNSTYSQEEEDCRQAIRAFLDAELDPHHDKFINDLEFDRQFWRKAGKAGLLGAVIPEEYGGPGLNDIISVILSQELGRTIGAATVGSSLEADLATHILMSAGSEEHRRRFAPGILEGEILQCVAMTEPDAGSDVTAIRTTAVLDGDEYIVNGTKVFISNANKADIIYLAVKTDPSKRGAGMSLLLVESNTPGITVSPIKTMGCPAYDLGELHFDNVRVPAQNLLLGEGRAMEILMATLMLDRLQVSARALGEAELALRLTLDHVKTRKAFGSPIADFQGTQFALAEMKTEIEVGRTFLHDGVTKLREGRLTHPDAAMIKLWVPQMTTRVIDKAFQLFGGYAFMDEMPISRLYTASRLHRLYVGTDEMQKITIARAM